jgi:1-acyl-sn-glycerol-3-phosphate acyltransferase
MKYLKYILIFFWRIWFYILTLSITIILFPLLIIVISREDWYPYFYKLARIWAGIILFGMGFIPKITYDEKIIRHKSYVFVPNHTSIIDIMLMLYLTKNPFVFLGKKELTRIPVFGFVYKRTCILVDRNNAESRNKAFNEAKKRIEKELSVCIFPEGKVPDDESTILDEFKSGAFRLGIMFEIPIVPIAFYDSKKRFSFTFFSGSPGILRARIHKFIHTENLYFNDVNKLKEQTHKIIYTDLKNDLNSNIQIR